MGFSSTFAPGSAANIVEIFFGATLLCLFCQQATFFLWAPNFFGCLIPHHKYWLVFSLHKSKLLKFGSLLPFFVL
jgi:hypothetical protein